MPPWFDWADRFTPLDVFLWVVGWGAFVLFVAPFLVTRSGMRIVRYKALPDDKGEVQPDGSEPDYAERYEELSQLGYLAAGVVRERVWFYQESIRRTHRVRAMVSEDGLVYAALYRIGSNGPVRVAFDSLTEKGVFVRTAMPGAGIPESVPDFHRTEASWRSVAELLEVHFRELRRIGSRGGGQPRPYTLEERAAVDEKVEARSLHRIGVGDTVWHLAAWIVTFLLVGGAIWANLNLSGPRIVGLALLAAGAAYGVFTIQVVPWLIGLAQWTEAPDPTQEEEPW